MTHIDRAPKPVSATISLAAGVVVVAIVADGPAQYHAVVVEVVGLGLLTVGALGHRSGQRVGGTLFGLAGGSTVLAALGLGWSNVPSAIDQAMLLPGLAGLAVLAAGVLGLRRGWERRLVAAGTGGLLFAVLLCGVGRGAAGVLVLAGAASTVVAWDAGEQAVNLGEQVGARAESWSAELVHSAGSIGVGVVAVGLAYGSYLVGPTEVPLAGLLLLTAGAVMVTAALYS